MRRLSGRMGGSGRQNVLFVAGYGDKFKSASDDESSEAWTLGRKAEKNLTGEKKGGQGGKLGEGKRGRGETEWRESPERPLGPPFSAQR